MYEYFGSTESLRLDLSCLYRHACVWHVGAFHFPRRHRRHRESPKAVAPGTPGGLSAPLSSIAAASSRWSARFRPGAAARDGMAFCSGKSQRVAEGE